jgi:DNA-binding NarL/FixJ family response regulator
MARPVSPLAVWLAFWKGLDEGLATSAAARAAGVSRATAYRWLGEDRQVLPSPFRSSAVIRPGSLSLREREEISFQLAQGQGVRQIAGLLGRAPSTISREVARNRGRIQVVVATMGFSGFDSSRCMAWAGVIPPSVLRGRLLSSVATSSSRSGE